MGFRGEVWTSKFSNDKRTYFFNVKENRLGDMYLNIVESKEKEISGFDRHQIVVFQEDLEEFLEYLKQSVDAMKNSKKKVTIKKKSN